MNKKFIPFSRKLTTKILLSVSIIVLIITVLVFAFSVYSMQTLTTRHYEGIMEKTNESVEKMLLAVEVSSRNVLDEVEYWVDSPDDVQYYLMSELEINPVLTGCSVGFVENYYPSKGKWFEPYATFENGKTSVSQIGSETHDYLQSEWFKDGLSSSAEGCWSNPYYDDAGAKQTLCTFSRPVHNADAEVIGVLGADISLEWLNNYLEATAEKENSEIDLFHRRARKKDTQTYSFILGRYGDYIAHPDGDRVLKSNIFDYCNNEKGRALGEAMINGATGTSRLNIDGEYSFVFYGPIRQTGWSMGIVVPMRTMRRPGRILSEIILIVILLGLLAITVICRRTVKRATDPLTKLAESAEEVAKGNFETELPNIKSNDEIRLLRDSFDNMQQSLTRYVAQLTETTARNASVERELRIAQNIQNSMLPKTFPPFPGRNDIDIYGTLTPARSVGGDIYDFFIRDGKLFFCVGDVSGKGIPASIVMAVSSVQFRTIANSVSTPDMVAKGMNASMVLRNDSQMFVTMFVGVLDLQTGDLEYCNAGHNAPIIISDKVGFLNTDSNVPIGVVPDFQYSLQKTRIDRGTTMFLYTDGLTEAQNGAEELFGELRLVEALNASAADSPRALVEDISVSVQRFVDGAEQSDDLTMLAIAYK